tara:strand:+ start:494 stop:889 length:396 start_codon:yes stop_codon:yes gene_type:complete
MELNVFGPSPTPHEYVYHSNTGGPNYYNSISRPGLEPGFFGIGMNVLPNAHDMFIDKVKPMIIKPDANINGIGDATTGAAIGLVGGGIIVLAGLSFLWGKYVGGWAVESISGTKLSDKQKNAIGITSLLLI